MAMIMPQTSKGTNGFKTSKQEITSRVVRPMLMKASRTLLAYALSGKISEKEAILSSWLSQSGHVSHRLPPRSSRRLRSEPLREDFGRKQDVTLTTQFSLEETMQRR